MASTDDAIFLDDDPRAVDVAAIAEAETRRVGITPHQFAVGTIEFQGLAEVLIAKALAFGQTRKGFLTSLASMWDQYHPAYKVLRRSQELAEAAGERARASAPSLAACGLPCGDPAKPCTLQRGHQEPCTP